jgi:hypothetical protein
MKVKKNKIFVVLMIALYTAFYSGNLYSTDQFFTATISVYRPIIVTVIQGLQFPSTMLTGSDINVVVTVGSPDAASFNANGSPNRSFVASVVQPSIDASAPGVSSVITMDNFLIAGPTSFNGSGDANGLRVGATAHILASTDEGTYSGIATFRVVYL